MAKLGKDYGALAECQRVARAYEGSMRIETLTFYHHQIAAPPCPKIPPFLARSVTGELLHWERASNHTKEVTP